MVLNASKTKELVIFFGTTPPNLLPLRVNGEGISSSDEACLLGLNITDNLKWSCHVDALLSKASRKLYLLIQLKRSGCSIRHLLQAYLTLIRPTLEYGCEVWHPGLNEELSKNLESIQKRAVKIILPHMSYDMGLSELNLTSLKSRRRTRCQKLYSHMQNPDHRLHSLLPEERNIQYYLRGRSNTSHLHLAGQTTPS